MGNLPGAASISMARARRGSEPIERLQRDRRWRPLGAQLGRPSTAPGRAAAGRNLKFDGPAAAGLRGLVSRRIDYDGLLTAENGQFLRGDEQLDAASDAGLLLDQAQLVERLEHLVD